MNKVCVGCEGRNGVRRGKLQVDLWQSGDSPSRLGRVGEKWMRQRYVVPCV